MKVIRTFHPIGQGAFYSERFYEVGQQNATHNIVFDCGTQKGGVNKAKKVVAQAFDANDAIDYLFISHLDYDHISLVSTLLKTVRSVKNIIMPLIAEEDLMIVMAYHRISGNRVTGFLRRIINHLSGNYDDDYFGGDYIIRFVGDDEADNINRGNSVIWNSGIQEQVNWAPDWVLIPYNVGYHSRKQELLNELGRIVLKPDFIAELQAIGEAPVQDAADLYDRLKNPDFVGKLIPNTTLKNAIKEAYEKITGGTNENSLLLYSGPENSRNNYEMRDSFPNNVWYWHNIFEAGCLYTGDSNSDLPNWKNVKYPNVWDNIGTIQLPHHGSLASFDVTANPIDRTFVFPVSCGSTNSYGHPSGKVLAYLLKNGCRPQIITEMASTLFMERIED